MSSSIGSFKHRFIARQQANLANSPSLRTALWSTPHIQDSTVALTPRIPPTAIVYHDRIHRSPTERRSTRCSSPVGISLHSRDTSSSPHSPEAHHTCPAILGDLRVSLRRRAATLEASVFVSFLLHYPSSFPKPLASQSHADFHRWPCLLACRTQ